VRYLSNLGAQVQILYELQLTNAHQCRITGMVLNSEQQEAVMRSICAKDYALLLGMPGTGKTTTISAIIKALVALGK